jgi:hypothetical protein
MAWAAAGQGKRAVLPERNLNQLPNGGDESAKRWLC